MVWDRERFVIGPSGRGTPEPDITVPLSWNHAVDEFGELRRNVERSVLDAAKGHSLDDASILNSRFELFGRCCGINPALRFSG
jgi:hypothetical protein